jgi:hypothetical protein
MEEQKQDVWSEWLDFNQSNTTTSNIPEKPGVFKVHASMKILYIGSSSTNLRQSVLESLSDPCIGKARRFSYLVTEKAEHYFINSRCSDYLLFKVLTFQDTILFL